MTFKVHYDSIDCEIHKASRNYDFRVAMFQVPFSWPFFCEELVKAIC